MANSKRIISRIKNKIFGLFSAEYKFGNRSFSQDGEDVILYAYFESKQDYRGFYVDIGAHHPYRFSNTAMFYKKGWSGINVEPTPTLINAFNRSRKRDVNLNVGVSDVNDELTFYEFDEAALNSFDEKISKDRDKNTPYNIISENKIPVFTLENILEDHLPSNQKIDFMTIDVEGLDLQVLRSNNWEKFRPDYILVEDKVNFENLSDNKMYQFLIDKNFKLVGRTMRTFLFKDVSID